MQDCQLTIASLRLCRLWQDSALNFVRGMGLQHQRGLCFLLKVDDYQAEVFRDPSATFALAQVCNPPAYCLATIPTATELPKGRLRCNYNMSVTSLSLSKNIDLL